MRWLQQNAADQVGIFRKPGVKSRIQALRNMVEMNVGVDYTDQQCYDVADMVKQYFRELPETLLTNKLSETFILIFQCKLTLFAFIKLSLKLSSLRNNKHILYVSRKQHDAMLSLTFEQETLDFDI